MRVRSCGLSLILWILACSGTPDPSTNPNGTPREPGTQVQVALSDAGRQALAALEPSLAAPASYAELEAQHPFSPRSGLSYDPSQALHLDLIQGSGSALSRAELDALKQHGFVISRSQVFPTFGDGYSAIYRQDLPLFVSADSILEAVHRSYDAILKDIEEQLLSDDLARLLRTLRERLASAGLDPVLAQDLDFYLAVPASLLAGKIAAPVAGANAEQIRSWTERAQSAEGHQPVELFGAPQDVDFSQFAPRGHYTISPTLERYFRAMMWLGRIELRLVETQQDGSTVFRRRPFEATLALRELLSEEQWTHYERIDSAYRLLVGASDNLTLDDVERLRADLGVADVAASRALTDAKIADVITAGGYGEQSIASQLMVNGTADLHNLPLNRSFLLIGQRYAIDSHVFSNVVFDRVTPDPKPRMMPDPLDVAFAALGNDQALGLLEEQVNTYHYARELGQMRTLADAHGDDFWNGSLYNLWLGALRELSPRLDASGSAGTGTPELAGTDAWGRRLLNAQMGSWAELRRDNILLVKQSYSSGISCEYPDAYIDPYPQFFARLAAFAERGRSLGDLLRGEAIAGNIVDYFTTLQNTLLILQQMAEYERAGTPFNAAQLAFINRAVATQSLGCGGGPLTLTGWYADLFYARDKALDFDPTIADVHTQFSDEGGNEVGRVLHVATGWPRLMVVTVDSCSGPRAYAGLAFAYHQLTLDGFQRMNDEQWKAKLQSSYTPPDPEWLEPALVP